MPGTIQRIVSLSVGVSSFDVFINVTHFITLVLVQENTIMPHDVPYLNMAKNPFRYSSPAIMEDPCTSP